MNKQKKVLPFMLAAAVATTPFFAANSAYAVKNVEVDADDTDTGETTDYEITFELEEDLDEGDEIIITFDDEFEIDEDIDENDVEVENKEANKVKYDEDDNSITIEAPDDYDDGDEITVELKDVITNPDDDDTYKITVETENDDDDDYDKVGIGDDADDDDDEDFTVTTDNNYAGKQTSWLLEDLDLDDDLKKNEWLEVTFPDKDMLPGDIKNSYVKINGSSVKGVEISGSTVKLKVPTGADDDDEAEIEFKLAASVNNPTSKKDNYHVKVKWDGKTYTSADYEVVSNPDADEQPITLSSNKAGEKSGYTIEANFDDEQLKPYYQLTIEFPSSFDLPSSISTSYVKLNGTKAKSVKVDDNEITITASGSFYSDNDVKVEISSSAGIKNPSTAGQYSLDLSINDASITTDKFSITK
ncbi:hypothetical protein [Brevibacillus fulvus]|uniref:Uncharacterized protein n=1 Tax=Brevibacillus fulvus TaxID=1125967 RepID=A0A938XZ82_9BACL|nr:hypothetical protein [Brevibacillus fulvus]MBM7588612.1 hypothetical protein [Brevibacillus fulvus]